MTPLGKWSVELLTSRTSLESILEGIAVGGAGGAIAGLVIWLFQWLREKITERGHKKKVYNWIYERTKQPKGLTVGDLTIPRWISTLEIASYTNLTPDRVRYVCSIHNKIRSKTQKERRKYGEPLQDTWAIREFVD